MGFDLYKIDGVSIILPTKKKLNRLLQLSDKRIETILIYTFVTDVSKLC